MFELTENDFDYIHGIIAEKIKGIKDTAKLLTIFVLLTTPEDKLESLVNKIKGSQND